MDIIDPASLIRKKGNLKITLTIDSALQHELETLVKGRGFGPDTTIFGDLPSQEKDSDLKAPSRPRDTLAQAVRAPRTG